MTGEHFRVILGSESDSDAFTAFARTLAVGEVPIMKAIQLGRITALRKPDGRGPGHRGRSRRFWRPQPRSSLPSRRKQDRGRDPCVASIDEFG